MGRNEAMELTEDQLIAAIRRVLSGEFPGVQVGIGDDAAVVEAGTGSTVLTTDMLIEGVHFERTSISARDLGAKSIVVNLSDIAAMAASPRYAMVSLGIPADVEAAWVMELFGGMRAACDEYALTLVGGDTNRADAIVIAVAVVGEVGSGHAVTRSGAHPGDLVVVTGSLGAAAGGFLLSRIHPSKLTHALTEPWGRELLDAQARPVARVGEGQSLAQAGATAMMDLSDGLAKDLSRLCEASGVGARVELARVPVAEALRRAAGFLEVDPLELALGGGEDYELLATIDLTNLERARNDLHERFGVTLTDVGVIIDDGLVAVDAEGRESPLEPKGWDHFATR
jgi:thiamine-monophosphate kinase